MGVFVVVFFAVVFIVVLFFGVVCFVLGIFVMVIFVMFIFAVIIIIILEVSIQNTEYGTNKVNLPPTKKKPCKTTHIKKRVHRKLIFDKNSQFDTLNKRGVHPHTCFATYRLSRQRDWLSKNLHYYKVQGPF